MNGHKHEFYCVKKELETSVLYDVFSFGVRSNSVISQVKIEREKSFVKQSFQNLIYADLFGKVLNLNLVNGNQVHKGELLLTLESMKTEIHVLSPSDARIKKVHVKAGEPVIERQLLLELEEIVSADSN
jgi:biotin carboxyl carrier protein